MPSPQGAGLGRLPHTGARLSFITSSDGWSRRGSGDAQSKRLLNGAGVGRHRRAFAQHAPNFLHHRGEVPIRDQRRRISAWPIVGAAPTAWDASAIAARLRAVLGTHSIRGAYSSKEGQTSPLPLRYVWPGRTFVAYVSLLLYWRWWSVRTVAPLTAELLRRRGRLDQEVARALADSLSDSEDLGVRLLERMRRDSDPVVASLAASEATLWRVARGDDGEYEIAWCTNPEVVIDELRNRRSRVSAFEQTAAYRFRVGRHCRGSYRP